MYFPENIKKNFLLMDYPLFLLGARSRSRGAPSHAFGGPRRARHPPTAPEKGAQEQHARLDRQRQGPRPAEERGRQRRGRERGGGQGGVGDREQFQRQIGRAVQEGRGQVGRRGRRK